MSPTEQVTIDADNEPALSRRGLLSGAGAMSALAGAAVLAGAQALAPTAAEATSADPVAHLLRRTTYGMNADQIYGVHQLGADKWLAAQMDPYKKVPDKAMDHLATRWPRIKWEVWQVRDRMNNGAWDVMEDLVDVHIARAIWSRRQLLEVMVDFWSNHFNITCPSSNVWDSRARFDRDVIRMNAFGRFEDMLIASAKHPAMLNYLNNAISTYKQPNENYGREVLELHTVGISAGYTEVDMHNSAIIFTGLSTDDQGGGGYLYKNYDHAVGKVKVMGFHDSNGSADGGEAVATRYLKYLANHQATALHICGKLITRFVSDVPQPKLVKRLAHIYLTGGTAIKPVLLALFASPEFKHSAGQKVRTPFEDLIGTLRALQFGPDKKGTDGIRSLQWVAQTVGQPPLAWSLPNGYPDVATAWSSSSSTLGRWNAHMALAGGWTSDSLTRTQLRNLLPANPPETLGETIDLLATKLSIAPLPTAHRNAIASFLTRPASSRIADDDEALGWRLPYLAALLLDSPTHVKR
ncbi:hypothetical protein acdb102_15610 [Acidothermaceae bacterium B102]|nr:hypothetical protein acdb102_15610 [Acidothermaceae bacterium B102]